MSIEDVWWSCILTLIDYLWWPWRSDTVNSTLSAVAAKPIDLNNVLLTANTYSRAQAGSCVSVRHCSGATGSFEVVIDLFDKHMQLLTVYSHVNILFMSCKCRLICHCHGFYFHSSVDSSSINYEHCSHGSIPWECIFQILCNLFQVKVSAKLRWYPILTFCNQVSSQITVEWQESLPGWAPITGSRSYRVVIHPN